MYRSNTPEYILHSLGCLGFELRFLTFDATLAKRTTCKQMLMLSIKTYVLIKFDTFYRSLDLGCDRSVGIVRSRIQATEFVCFWTLAVCFSC
jgi:hypothetical protein